MRKAKKTDGTVELAEADYRNMIDFIKLAANCTKDGECANCGKDGNEDNSDCGEDHAPFDMPNDDAVETLHSLISRAREVYLSLLKPTRGR